MKKRINEKLHIGMNGNIKFLFFGENKLDCGHCISLRDLITGRTTDRILNDWFDTAWNAPEQMSQSETLYGFMAWLTTRQEPLHIGWEYDCAPVPVLIDAFCKANGLKSPRENWEENYKVPVNSDSEGGLSEEIGGDKMVNKPDLVNHPLTLRDSVPETPSAMKHVMIDLEFLGNGADALITTLGACEFDPATGKIGRKFYEYIDWESSLEMGRTVSARVIKWWMIQASEAQVEIFQDGRPLTEVLSDFAAWFPEEGKAWSNGACDDISKLTHAYGFENTPWNFRDVRDLRTLKELAEDLEDKDMVMTQGVKHNALDDAVWQATYASAMWQALCN